MNASGGGEISLTASDGVNSAPSWSRDGRRILFESSRDGDLEIFVMERDGSGETPLTSDPANDEHPDW